MIDEVEAIAQDREQCMERDQIVRTVTQKRTVRLCESRKDKVIKHREVRKKAEAKREERKQMEKVLS